MADFSKFANLQITRANTAQLKLHQIEVNGRVPTLTLLPATEANPAYFNKLLKRAGKQARALRANNFTASMLAENRGEDRELYPAHVISGWTNVIDHSTGEDVPFNVSNCVDFVTALPDWLFDEVRDFAANAANFYDQPDTDAISGN